MSLEKKIIERFRTRLTRILAIIAFGFFAFCDSKWSSANPIFKELLSTLGIILVSVGACGRLWCTLYISGYKTNSLVLLGPYSMCRNPLYLFSFLGAVGVSLGSATLTVPAIFVFAFLASYPIVIKKEENRLLEIHGDLYKSYYQKTPSIIPSFVNYAEPASYVVNPIIFRKHMFNAILWVWFYGLWELFEFMRQTKIIPTFFTIW